MKIKESIRAFADSGKKDLKNIGQILKILIVIGFFAALFLIVDFRDVIDTLLSTNLRLFLIGFFLVIPVEFLTTYQHYSLMRLQGIDIRFLSLLQINLAIKFYLIFLPGAFVGSGMRWYRVSQPEGKRAETLAAIAFNRVFEIFLVVIFGLSFWVASGSQRDRSMLPGLLALTILITLIWLLLTRSSRIMSSWLSKFSNGKSFPGTVDFFIKNLKKLLDAVGNYQDIRFSRLIVLVALGLLRLMIGLISFYFIARSVGINIPFVDMGWIRSIMMITMILPLSIAGGLGIREASLIVLLSGFGIAVEISIAFSFLIYIRQILIGIAGGIIEGLSTFLSRKKSAQD